MDGPSEDHRVDELLAHAEWLRDLARHLVGQSSQGEESVQDTWLAALRSPPHRGTPIRPWLARVLRNAIGQARRKAGHRRSREELAARDETVPSTDELAERIETQRMLAALVLDLPEPYRSVIMLRFYEGLTAAEIAKRQHVPAGTVRWRISEGLARLRLALGRRFDGGRSAWSMALVPITGAEWGRASAPAGALTVISGVLTTKLFMTAGVVLGSVALLLLGLGQLGNLSREGAVEHVETAAHEPIPAGEGENDPGLERVKGQTTERREAAGGSGGFSAEGAPEASLPTLHILARVVDSFGRPMAGTVLSVSYDKSATATSGADGWASLEVKEVPRGARLWNCVVSAPGYALAEVPFSNEPGGEIELGEITMYAGGVVAGRIRDPSGQPLAGVLVLAHKSRLPSDGWERGGHSRLATLATATTDPLGHFRLEGLRPGLVHVGAHKQGLQSSSLSEIPVREGTETGGIELTLSKSHVIAGTLLGLDGEPVPAAEVTCSLRHGDGDHYPCVATTDAAGHFQLEGKRAGTARLRARRSLGAGVHGAMGEQAHVAELAGIRTGSLDVVLQLVEPRWIEVVLVDERGVPVDSAEAGVAEGRRDAWTAFAALRWDYSPELRPRETPGTFWLELPLRPFHLHIESPGHQPVITDLLEPGALADSLQFTLTAWPAVRGRVLAGGKPLEGARVFVDLAVPDSVEFEMAGFPLLRRPANVGPATTDRHGRFRLPLDTRELEGSTLFLRAVADGHASGVSAEMEPDSLEGLGEVEIHLSPGGAIEGMLRMEDGKDPAGTIVGASCGDAGIRTVRVESDGRFHFDHLRPGPWLVRTTPQEVPWGHFLTGDCQDGLLPVEWDCEVVEGHTASFDIDLASTTARLAGRLMMGGAAPGPRVVSLSTKLREAERWTGATYSQSVVQPNGRFDLVGAARTESTLWMCDRSRSEEGVQQIIDRLLLAPGDNNWALDLEVTSIEGRIEGEAAKRAGSLFHVWRDQGNVLVLTRISPDAEGCFLAPAIPVGPGTIRQSGLCEWSEVVKGSVLLELEIPPGGLRDVVIR